jgi:GNAT superfamily N-acetyltransferase
MAAGHSQIVVRPVVPADEPDWRRLWAGYLTFYRQALAPEITDLTWRRLIDAGTRDMIGRVAAKGDEVIGILHAVVHANTWSAAPVCYLEDLFVDPDRRRSGAGRALIEGLAAEGRQAGWQRIYWRTASDNLIAQKLYDEVACRSGWIIYERDLLDPDAPAQGGPGP